MSKGAGDGRVTLASCKRRSTPLALQLRTISGSSGTASSAAAPSAGTGSGSVGSAASSAALTDSTTATRTSPLSTLLIACVACWGRMCGEQNEERRLNLFTYLLTSSYPIAVESVRRERQDL